MSIKKISYQIRDCRWDDIYPKSKTLIRDLMKEYILPTIYSDYETVKVTYFLKSQKDPTIEYLIYDSIEDFLYGIKVLLKQNEYNYTRYGKKLFKRLKKLTSITKTNHMIFKDVLYDNTYVTISSETKK